MEKKLVILASGTGSNAKKIIEYFQDDPEVGVALVISNRKNAPVLDMARDFGIETLHISRSFFYDSKDILRILEDRKIDFVVLAGFLWLIPAYFVEAFAGRMINIHPALLPKYGGKGMYGMNVHRAVKEAGEKESGITIHHVNSKYDEGDIIFQASCSLEQTDSPETIAKKVQILEHQHFAPIIKQLLKEFGERQ